MTETTHFWTLLGIEEKTIPELKRLENLLNDLQKEPSNEDKLLNNTDALIRILETLCKNSYSIFKSIDIKKRQQLIESVSNKWKRFNKELKQILSQDTWEMLFDHAQALTKLCSLDFNIKPLMFARQALKYQDMTKQIECQVIQLIDQMRDKHPNILNDILDDEYKQIKTNHREKIVITVLGSTKASKSSLINFLLEQDICPTGNQAATARLTKITYGQQIILTLTDSSGRKLESYYFDTTEKLLQRAKEMIILKNEERKSQLCHDEILIQLPIDELKGVELWDVPGYDENPILNERIHEILKDSDLILAVLAQQECLRQTAIDFIKPCLKQNQLIEEKNQINKPITKICFIISQIDRYKPDQQTNETREEFLQHIYKKIQDELQTNFQEIDYKFSNQFIPMCSHPIHSIKDYLECREEFIEKSYQWYRIALDDLTRYRTNLLLKSIKEFSNYENLFRQQERYERIKQIFNQRFTLFSQQLTDNVNEKLQEIHLIMKESIENIVLKCRNLFNNDENLDDIEKYIHKQLTKIFAEILKIKTPALVDMISERCLYFSNTIELKPPEIQMLKQVLNDTLTKDYYTNIIKQYEYTSPYHLSSYLTRIFDAVTETLKATVNIPFGDFNTIKKAFEKFTRRDKYVEEKTMDSILNVIHEVLENVSEKLQQKTEKTLKDILDNQLNRIHKEIEKKAQKYIRSSTNDTKIDHLRQFSKENFLKIKQIHLDILDIQFNLDYSIHYQINQQERLDSNRIYPIYTGTLGKSQHPIAAKLMPLNDFKLQEVIYLRELKHKNVIKYYGVKKFHENQYYVIMTRLDCNLRNYLEYQSQNFQPIDIDNMIVQISKGLDYIHTQLELIHRNIKLENILVNQIKKRFIIADLHGIDHQPITCIYKNDLMPPELLSTDNPAMITEKSDIYSFGILIKQIIKLAHLEQSNDKFIISWLKLAQKCCSQEPSIRPSCRYLLDKRFQ